MRNLLLGIIAINLTFISLDTNAFEFKGVKSGMSESEIIAVTGFSSSINYASSSEIKKWMGHSLYPIKIEAKYKYLDRRPDSLWQLIIVFEASSDPIYQTAKARALDEVCDVVSKATSSFNCFFTDKIIFEAAVKIEKERYLEALK